MNAILGFTGDNDFLSNFHRSIITCGGYEYKTVEHAYQASKAKNPDDFLKIVNCETPGQAKRFGQKIHLIDNWEFIKLEVMRFFVELKFKQNKELKERLLGTGNAYICELNTWNDKFWGVVRNEEGILVGHNHLGIILQNVRSRFKGEGLCI